MDIGNVKGAGGVDRGTNRPHRTDKVDVNGTHPTPADKAHGDQAHGDQASISDDSRDLMAVVNELSESLRNEPPTRQERMSAALERLEAGAYDTPEVHEQTARRVLEDLA